MKIVTFIIQASFVALMVGVAGLFLLPLLPIDNNIQLRIVESGSMEPQIMTGSLVVIVPASEYKIGDVITFKSRTADVPTTHRIVDSAIENGSEYFTTKGDANEEADSAPAYFGDVLGKVFIVVPYAGFILDFARQPIGFSLLIVLPALMIIFAEIEKIWIEIRNRRNKSLKNEFKDEDDDINSEEVVFEQKSVRMMDVATPVRLRVLPTLDLRNRKPINPLITVYRSKNYVGQWATVFLVFLGSSIFVTASFLPYTASYFNDIERSVSNSMKASMLDFTASSNVNNYNFIGDILDNENSTVISVINPEIGSVDVKYDVSVYYVSGNELFCNSILVDVSTPFLYNGPFTSLFVSNVNILEPLSLNMSLSNSSLFTLGEICQVDIVYTAWNSDVNNGEGYSDEERVPLTFYAPVVMQVFRSLLSSPLIFDISSTTVIDKAIIDGEEVSTSTIEKEPLLTEDITTEIEVEFDEESIYSETSEEEIVPDEPIIAEEVVVEIKTSNEEVEELEDFSE